MIGPSSGLATFTIAYYDSLDTSRYQLAIALPLPLPLTAIDTGSSRWGISWKTPSCSLTRHLAFVSILLPPTRPCSQPHHYGSQSQSIPIQHLEAWTQCSQIRLSADVPMPPRYAPTCYTSLIHTRDERHVLCVMRDAYFTNLWGGAAAWPQLARGGRTRGSSACIVNSCVCGMARELEVELLGIFTCQTSDWSGARFQSDVRKPNACVRPAHVALHRG